MIEKLYTVEEVAELASVTGRTIRNYLKSGRLVGRKIGGQWRFPEAEVQRLLTGAVPDLDETAKPPISLAPDIRVALPQAAPQVVVPEDEPAPGYEVNYETVSEPEDPVPVQATPRNAAYYNEPAPLPGAVRVVRSAPHPSADAPTQPLVPPNTYAPAQPVYAPPFYEAAPPHPHAHPVAPPLAPGPMPYPAQPMPLPPTEEYAPPQPYSQAYPPALPPSFVVSPGNIGYAPSPYPPYPVGGAYQPTVASYPVPKPPEAGLPLEEPPAKIKEPDHSAHPQLSDVGNRVTKFISEVHDYSKGPQMCSVIDLHQSFSAARGTSQRLSEIADEESENGQLCQCFVEFDERFYVARYTLFGTTPFLLRCLKLIG